jgi:hypothetical protein
MEYILAMIHDIHVVTSGDGSTTTIPISFVQMSGMIFRRFIVSSFKGTLNLLGSLIASVLQFRRIFCRKDEASATAGFGKGIAHGVLKLAHGGFHRNAAARRHGISGFACGIRGNAVGVRQVVSRVGFFFLVKAMFGRKHSLEDFIASCLQRKYRFIRQAWVEFCLDRSNHDIVDDDDDDDGGG